VFGGQGFHLWFLPTLGLTILIVFLIKRFTPLTLQQLVLIGGLFYICAVFLTAAIDIKLEDQWLRLYSTRFVRSSFLNSFYFFVLGMAIRQWHIHLHFPKAFALLVFSIVLFVCEYGLWQVWGGFWPSQDIKLSLMFLAPALFLTFLALPSERSYGKLAQAGQLSLGIYALHLMFILLIKDHSDAFLSLEPGTMFISQMILVVLVFASSALLSYLVSRIRFLQILVR
jgi:hypothetical protein